MLNRKRRKIAVLSQSKDAHNKKAEERSPPPGKLIQVCAFLIFDIAP